MAENLLEIEPILLEAEEESSLTRSGASMEGSVIPPFLELSIEDLNDSTASQDLISELKLKKFTKPQDISLEKWEEAPLLSKKCQAIVVKASEGIGIGSIAKSLGIPAYEVKAWLEHPIIQEEIIFTQDELFGKDSRKRIELLGAKGIEVVKDIMGNPKVKDQVRLAAATYAIDQAIGKSNQNIEVKGTLLIDVMKKLESLPPAERVKSKMEQLVLEVIPESVTVGKRYE